MRHFPLSKLAAMLVALAATAMLSACHAPAATQANGAAPSPASATASPGLNPAVNAPVSVADREAVRRLVRKVSNGRAQVISIWNQGSGLLGILYKGVDGSKQVGWATQNAKILLPGLALSIGGKNLNQEELAARAGYLSPTVAWKRLLAPGTESFTIGHAGPRILAVVDPNCIFCHLFYKKVMPLVRAGRLRVTFVMAAILKPSSLGKAATILAARDPAAALAFDELHFDKAKEEGGIRILPAALKAKADLVRANSRLLAEMGPAATPTILACHKGAADPEILRGMPGDIDVFTSSLATAAASFCNR